MLTLVRPRNLHLSFLTAYYKRPISPYSITSPSIIGTIAWIAMENKGELPSITKLSEHVTRILGQNPGKFTLQGTNTYLIGASAPYILIDTAEGRPEYIPVLASALAALQSESPISTHAPVPIVSDIILSHWHHDHVGGIPGVLTLLRELWTKSHAGQPYTPPKLHKYPLGEDKEGQGHNSSPSALPKLLEGIPKDLYTPASDTKAFHDLHDSQTFVAGSEAGKTTLLTVLHTPGHTTDSICLHIPADKALYTADTVLGHGTAVFDDLASYLNSLNKMFRFGINENATSPSGEDTDPTYVSLYPGHGQLVANGRETIATYIKHRLDRETQILQVLQTPVPAELLDGSSTPGAPKHWTTWTLVRNIYAAYPESLWLPASRSIYLHLKKLEGEGSIRRIGGEGKDVSWEPLNDGKGGKMGNL